METTASGIEIGYFSDAGIKPVNDDACGTSIPDDDLLLTKGMAAAIADGVSSSEAGKEASEACIRGFLSDYFSTPDSWTVKTSGQRVLGSINSWLNSQSTREYNTDRALLTTLSILVIKSGTAHMFHVGDTRIYRIRDNDLECLTRDHQLRTGSGKIVLARAMGADTQLDIDYRTDPVEAGDIYFLSTDGVHEFIGQQQLKEMIVSGAAHPQSATKKIIHKALDNGSKDNVTCMIVRVDKIPGEDSEQVYKQLTDLPFPPFLEPGMIFDGYQITREIHASKRTQVYAAQDTETGARVILKTPSVNYNDDAAFIEQFRREEWIGRRINNRNVLKIVDSPRRQRFLYYVTEYIEGTSLREWMDSNPRPSYIGVRDIIEQIAAGLRAFHKLEMVHRDLKPENVMIDDNGRVIIIDFGSTRIAGIDEIDTPFERNPMLGTLGYAAPESFQGYNGSYASDTFALGVVAYEMLTAKLPYGKPLSAPNISKARYTSAKHYFPEVPAWVDAALAKAVSINPDKRYKQMSEFVHDLANPNPEFLDTVPIPLIKRNPLAFWRGLSFIMALINLILLYLLLNS
jgi:serine/threonine protein phosphatase PrpC